MRRLSIRARLTLWYTGILAATLLILGGVAYGLLLRGLWRDVDTTLESLAKAVAHSASQSDAGAGALDMDALMRRFFAPGFADRFYQFLDPRGQVDPRYPRPYAPLAVSPNGLKNATEGYATYETIPGPEAYPIRILTFPIVAGGKMLNVLQVGMSLEGLYRERTNFLWTLAALIPVALVLAGGSGWLLARRALRPVDRMTQAARRIGAERLAQRLEGAETDDELGRLARTLNEMLGRLEAGFVQVRRFTADASHELRTPLTVMKGEMEVALRSARDPEEYRRVMASALEEVARMGRLVDDLLVLSRADAGALRWGREPVELDRLTEEVAKQGEVLGRGRGVVVRIQHLEPLIAEGDEQRLKQLLLNLVDNAVKYTPAGGQVTLTLRQVAGTPGNRASEPSGTDPNREVTRVLDCAPTAWAEIAVQDAGAGIPAEALPRIFERFYRVDDARSREVGGAGLGLCIAKTIAEAHGGPIEVESALGVGSTFIVRLPLCV